MSEKIWFVTGTSSGFGQALVNELIAQKQKIVATARHLDQIVHWQKEYKNVYTTSLDVTNHDDVVRAVNEAIKHFGKIDILVNNAGWGYFGSAEESDESTVREMMDTNFWGAADVTRTVLPFFRKQRSGRIINITSVGGLVSSPAFGFYNASKFALEGLSSALAKEVAPLGIYVTNIEPGPYRTKWAGSSHKAAIETIDDYQKTAHANANNTESISGKQDGSPELAAKAIFKLANMTEPPFHFLTGINAYQRGTALYQETLTEFKNNEADSTHLNYGDEDYWK
ncbi:oxidoreductase [Oenococcus oeni]|uniref:oxidoreductase n=1 Tax=Oenococcus oeni TaxID=1247 RepID=UPI000277B427|nr:oxidoreductase [Oenococcus oeni]EJO07921.1 Short-chain dehydrogenase of various substrate specificities [Oenococcus oeni AWRIB548]KEP85283.1 short-chain dehydrogenase [Oenococcus oeni IOEB_0205]KGH66023.1 short-chain dehydrogenase [Oenococcus oeni IOEB_B16]OIL81747.1 short-chain dehydrogenase/reductase [Oenococcus oeni]PDH76758.1 short-chain dehydrogenase [Oenococcus oeni]